MFKVNSFLASLPYCHYSHSFKSKIIYIIYIIIKLFQTGCPVGLEKLGKGSFAEIKLESNFFIIRFGIRSGDDLIRA